MPFRKVPLATLLATMVACSHTAGAPSLEALVAEKISLQQRLAKINAGLDEMRIAGAAKLLGMTLIDPSERLMKLYDLPSTSPGPIIARAAIAESFFPRGRTPLDGCAFYVVEHPGHGFLFNTERSPSYRPLNVRQLAESIVASTVAPQEYERLWEEGRRACRESAEGSPLDSTDRLHLLHLAEEEMPQEDKGKYICRVVYHYPRALGKRGTMTTYMRMTRTDLDEIRRFLSH